MPTSRSVHSIAFRPIYLYTEGYGQVVNEEGLPFVDIQEFEDDEGAPAPAPTTSQLAPKDNSSFSAMMAATSGYIKPRLARQMPSLPEDLVEIPKEEPSTSAKPRQPSTSKKVAFTPETKQTSASDGPLPVIGSSSALSQKGPVAPKAPVGQVQERPVKGSIVERDTTRPPPVLTAAERSLRGKNTPLSDAQSFDGIVSHNGKSVDMSAYLPKSMRAPAKPDKGKGREVEEEDQPEESEDDQDEEDEEDSDSDGLYQYDDSDDEDDDDNYHIDDVLAMREAALQYHARRYDLGAGAGTGPLGGNKRPDEYDEVSIRSSA